MRTKKRLREVLCQGGGARHDQSLRESLLSRDAAGLVSLKEAASNLRANLENLDSQSTVWTSQGEEGRGGEGGTQTRKSGEKRKKEAPASVPAGFFYRFIDLNKHDAASKNKTHL